MMSDADVDGYKGASTIYHDRGEKSSFTIDSLNAPSAGLIHRAMAMVLAMKHGVSVTVEICTSREDSAQSEIDAA